MRQRAAWLSFLPLLVLVACDRPQGSRTSHHDSRTFAATPGKLVLLDLGSLDAEVEVVEGGEVVVDVTLAARSSSRAAARRWVARNTPEFDDSAARLEVKVARHGSSSVFGFIATEGKLRVTLPAQCTLEVRTASGDVELSGPARLSTPVRVTTSSGDVTVRGAAKELVLETSSGDVRVTGTPLEVFEADTASGDVRLDAGAGRAVVDTSSGEVTLRGLSGDLLVTTASGDVEARWSRPPAGKRIIVNTSSGEVGLRLPAGVRIAGELRTTSGHIESEFPGEEDRRGRRFTLGAAAATTEQPQEPGASSGATEVSVRTTSGGIQVRKAHLEI